MKHALTLIVTTILLIGPLAAAPAFAQGIDPDKVVAEKVPAIDPAPTKKIEVTEKMRGVHPRLVFTDAEFAAVLKAAESDRIMGEQVQGILAAAPRGKLNERLVKKIFNGPTPALVTAFDGPLPEIVMAHGLKPTPQTKQALIDMLTIMVDTPHWETRGEVDSGMQAGAVMTLAGLTFDLICDDLDPAFRKKAAEKLFQQARRMYYLGHLQRSPAKTYYWQQDPQNNHRWHRNVGLVSCLLAVADEPGIDAGWLLEKTVEEMDFVTKWLPEDGDCHESITYSTFGFPHLAIAATMMDRVLGTKYTQHPGFHNAWQPIVYSYSPQRPGHLSYGDTRNRPGRRLGKSAAFFIGPKLSQDPDAQAAMIWYYDHTQADRTQITWLMLPFYDPNLKPGDIANLPKYRFFADLGLAYFRDSWQDDATLLMFKCGPYGGFKLNDYREANDRHYINVAHDDPDANTFSFVIDGQIVPHASGYDNPKRTANHNTWLVAERGQIGDGGGWMQPPDLDLRDFAWVTGWKVTDAGRAIIEGEAGKAYAAESLKGYRRTLAWLPGEYVLILDDLQADSPTKLAWNAVAEKGEFVDAAAGKSAFVEGNVRLPYQILANRKLRAYIDPHLTKGKDKYELQSTRYKVTDTSVRTAALLNVWQREGLAMTFTEKDSVVNVHVIGPGIDDLWVWRRAADGDAPSAITATRDGKPLVALTKDDAVKRGEHKD